MNYREANLNDLNSLIEMRLAYILDDYGEISKEEVKGMKENLPGYFNEHLGKDMLVYVAEENKEIVSTVFLLVIEKPANPSFLSGKTGTILNVYTKPEYRHRGAAGKLMNIAIEYGKKNNLSYLDLHATQDGYLLYKKLGFKDDNSKYKPMKYRF